LIQLNSIIEQLRSYMPTTEVVLVEKAYHYAETAHANQLRKSGDPYFIHPLSVTQILLDMRMDVGSLCAGLLHDVVEDTATELETIEHEFGSEIAELVDGLTKLNKINFYSKEDRQAESFRKMVVAMSKDVRVLLVKLCDRLDNMRTMEHMKPSSQERISRETSEIYAPLAHRLGMAAVKRELEDLSLQYIDPEGHAEITRQLASGQKERSKYIDGVSKTIRDLLNERGFACEVSGRPRHLTSLYRKMRSLKCSFDQIYDLIAFQVCVESVSDCYTTLGAIHSKWMPVPGRFKDYIALPKANRYQSLHTTVMGPGRMRLEIQIRTHEMHLVAEQGVVAEWAAYAPRHGAGRPSSHPWLRELESFQRDLKDPAEFLEVVKSDLFPDEVFVFTPKGELRMFPRGATPLDFAYSVHSEVGEHCSKARANGQEVSLRYKMRNGDVIEVVTDEVVMPTKDWLECCVSPRARSKIRVFLRDQHRHKSVNLGKELLDSELQRSGMSLQRLLKQEELLSTVLRAFEAERPDDLFLSVGFGKTQPHEVVDKVMEQRSASVGPDAPVPELKTGRLEKLVRRISGKPSNGIVVNGHEDVLVRYAKCCNPVHGDPIIGFMTRGRGVAVHRRDCTKAFDTTDPERRVEVNWSSDGKINRPVSLAVTTRNTPGILAKISQAFSSQKINLSEANCRASDDGSAENVFTFLATDVAQLRAVMRALSKVQGVVSVERL
jgi:GTP diphosphokinase / guanosine-3',5'-bis(diphosphate) 3'-diphosphatase